MGIRSYGRPGICRMAMKTMEVFSHSCDASVLPSTAFDIFSSRPKMA